MRSSTTMAPTSPPLGASPRIAWPLPGELALLLGCTSVTERGDASSGRTHGYHAAYAAGRHRDDAVLATAPTATLAAVVRRRAGGTRPGGAARRARVPGSRVRCRRVGGRGRGGPRLPAAGTRCSDPLARTRDDQGAERSDRAPARPRVPPRRRTSRPRLDGSGQLRLRRIRPVDGAAQLGGPLRGRARRPGLRRHAAGGRRAADRNRHRPSCWRASTTPSAPTTSTRASAASRTTSRWS